MTSSKKFPKRNGNQNVLSHPVTVGLEVKGKGKRDERYIRRLHSTRPLQESETVVTCAASDTIQTNRYVILLYVRYSLLLSLLYSHYRKVHSHSQLPSLLVRASTFQLTIKKGPLCHQNITHNRLSPLLDYILVTFPSLVKIACKLPRIPEVRKLDL